MLLLLLILFFNLHHYHFLSHFAMATGTTGTPDKDKNTLLLPSWQNLKSDLLQYLFHVTLSCLTLFFNWYKQTIFHLSSIAHLSAIRLYLPTLSLHNQQQETQNHLLLVLSSFSHFIIIFSFSQTFVSILLKQSVTAETAKCYTLKSWAY